MNKMIEMREEDIRDIAIELPDEIKFFKYSGDFAGERTAIAAYLQKDIPDCLRRRLALEDVMAAGMQHDYRRSFDELLADLQKRYPLCQAAHLEEIIRMGNADYIRKNGERFFQNSARSNILNCNATFLSNIGKENPQPAHYLNERRHENLRIMRENGFRAVRVRVCEHLKPTRASKMPGDTVRAHLPFPCACDVQSDIVIHNASHPFFLSDAAQRTAFAEVPYTEGLQFDLEFSYTLKVPYVQPRSEDVSADQPTFHTGERWPQIRFTPLILETAKELKGRETNPLILARRAYDFVTKHVVYSYMREYLCIENIAEFALMNGRGDCGVQALLFINLCRAMGVPATWESGSHVECDSIGSHDWARFYVAPYGWLWCDPSFGGGALRNGDEELWNHYATGFDTFREINSTEINAAFNPPRRYLRTDPYDNQSGEAEFGHEPMWHSDFDTWRDVVSYEDITKQEEKDDLSLLRFPN